MGTTSRQFGIDVLQEKNLTGGIHTRYITGYKVWGKDAERSHRGGISIVW